jgi:hypothetical protein
MELIIGLKIYLPILWNIPKESLSASSLWLLWNKIYHYQKNLTTKDFLRISKVHHQ